MVKERICVTEYVELVVSVCLSEICCNLLNVCARRVDVNPGCVEVGRFRFSHFINDLDFCSVSSHLFCV